MAKKKSQKPRSKTTPSAPANEAASEATAAPAAATPSGPEAPEAPGAELGQLSGTHLRWGWWSLLAFIILGTVLEMLHGFKVGWYLDVGNETRRLMWQLAHAHGTLLSLVHVAFGVSIRLAPSWSGGGPKLASRCLMAAGILMPLGFLLGGVFIYGGDPGLGVFLVPVGALALFVAVLTTARAPFKG